MACLYTGVSTTVGTLCCLIKRPRYLLRSAGLEGWAGQSCGIFRGSLCFGKVSGSCCSCVGCRGSARSLASKTLPALMTHSPQVWALNACEGFAVFLWQVCLSLYPFWWHGVLPFCLAVSMESWLNSRVLSAGEMTSGQGCTEGVQVGQQHPLRVWIWPVSNSTAVSSSM